MGQITELGAKMVEDELASQAALKAVDDQRRRKSEIASENKMVCKISYVIVYIIFQILAASFDVCFMNSLRIRSYKLFETMIRSRGLYQLLRLPILSLRTI
jgi:hypothetical protein